MTHAKKSRIRLSPTQEQELFAEVNGKCPLCGDSLVAEKNGRRIRVYDAAHIYPHSPTTAQRDALKDVPIPSDIECPQNIILLCKKCHKLQDDATSTPDFLRLYKVKQEKFGAYRAAQETSTIDIEPELKLILDNLSCIDDAELVALSPNTFPVKEKIEGGGLQRKVISYVTTYYETLKRMLQSLDDKRASTSLLIASQFKQSFLKQGRIFSPCDKEQIFNGLVEWVQLKTGGSKIACEAVVSFYIQSCEVFDAISK